MYQLGSMTVVKQQRHDEIGQNTSIVIVRCCTIVYLLRSTGRLEMRSLGMPLKKRSTLALTPDGASTTSTSLALSKDGGKRGWTCAQGAHTADDRAAKKKTEGKKARPM